MNPSDICKSRGISRVIHFHTDHWEPDWWAVQDCPVATIFDHFTNCPLTSAFVRAPVVPQLDLPDSYDGPSWPVENDRISFRLANYSHKIHQAIRYANEYLSHNVDWHVHVHHEYFTASSFPDARMNQAQIELHDWANHTNSPELDRRRVATAIHASLVFMGSAVRMPPDDWSFIHGCWALAASDPEVCQLEDELSLLHSLGCRADFSFPAGRQHCDPVWTTPKSVLPAKGKRAYELPNAKPQQLDGSAVSDRRMVVWSSCPPGTHWRCSIDYFSETVKRQLKDAKRTLSNYFLQHSPVINNTAYLKTHAHSMHESYWIDGVPKPPLKRFMPTLRRWCDAAHIELELATVREVLARLAPRHAKHPQIA